MTVLKAEYDELAAYADSLYGYAIHLSRDSGKAEDLVQETYVRALAAAGRLRLDSNIRSWLFTILRNIWFNQLRQKRNGPTFVELDRDDEAHEIPATDAHNGLEIYMFKMEQEAVRSAIQSLRYEYREIIRLREFEYLSYEDIGAILKCPLGTVMSRLARARMQLREKISDIYGPSTTMQGEKERSASGKKHYSTTRTGKISGNTLQREVPGTRRDRKIAKC